MRRFCDLLIFYSRPCLLKNNGNHKVLNDYWEIFLPLLNDELVFQA